MHCLMDITLNAYPNLIWIPPFQDLYPINIYKNIDSYIFMHYLMDFTHSVHILRLFGSVLV